MRAKNLKDRAGTGNILCHNAEGGDTTGKNTFPQRIYTGKSLPVF
jgi:hypothetical protein